MFGNGRKAANGTAGGRRGSFSVLGAEVAVTGDMVAADLHLDGRIDGDVRCGALVLGVEGTIAGAVTADTARIAGTVEGTVSVRGLTVERTAQIAGDVVYETITIEPGARVDGQLRRLVPEADRDAPPAAESGPREAPRLVDAEAQAA